MNEQQKKKKARQATWKPFLVVGAVMFILLIPNIVFFFILKNLALGPDFNNLLSMVIGLASVLIGIASVIIPILQIYQEKRSPDIEILSPPVIISDTQITSITPIPTSIEVIAQYSLLPQQYHGHPIINMGEAPQLGILYGRENEIEGLKKWIIGEHCQLVAVLGIGGIGKTHLIVHVVEQIKDTFEYVLWQSLLNAPPLEYILKNSIQFFSNQQQTNIPADTYNQINLLITYLNNHRCLLILDNMESIWRAGEKVGEYRDGYEEYGQFLRRMGESKHQSCVLATSREKPPEIASLEGKTKPVRSLRIRGLQIEGGEAILKEKGLQEEYAWKEVIERCEGNPLILQLVSQFILEVFGGSTQEFLVKGKITFSNAQDVLQQQFERLTPLEQEILYWLAIEREAVSKAALEENFISPILGKDPYDALVSLSRRSLIEINVDHYFLQNVIIEYITDRLVEYIINEIKNEHYLLFDRYALIKAKGKNYVRQSQERLILEPIATSLRNQFLETAGGYETKLVHALTTLRTTSPPITGYAAGNMLNLFIALKCPSHMYNFSDLTIRQAYLQGIKLSESNFTRARFVKTTFTDTFGSVLCVAFSPDGQLFAAGTANGEVRLWNRSSMTLLRTYHGHTDWVRSIAFSHDSLMLCSGSYDQTVRLWNVHNERCIKIFREQACRVYSVAFSPDRESIASGHEDAQVRFWSIKSGLCLRRLEHIRKGRVWSVAFSPDGTKLASGSDDATVHLWRVDSGQCLGIMEGHAGTVYSVAFSPDNQMLASSSEDATICLWDITNKQCLNTLREHKGFVYSVAFSPDGKTLASGSADQTTRLWDIQNGKSSAILQDHTNWVYSVAFSPDGMEIGTGSEDQTIQIYDKNTGQCVSFLQGYCVYIYSVAFSPDGTKLVSGDKQGVRLWNPKNKQCLKLLSGHMNSVRAVAFSPDGKMLASGSEDQHILLWETETDHYTHRLQGHSRWVTTVTFSPDGKLLASGSNDRTIRLWKVSSGTCISLLEGHEDWIRSVKFSPDGKLLISGSEDQTVRFWDVESGTCLKVLYGNNGRVCSVACGPDGQIVASGHGDGIVNLWNTRDGSCYRVLQGHSERVCSVAFSPDGQTLASGGEDQTVKLWKIDTGECIATLKGHSSWIYSIAFNPTGKWLASGSGDETIKIWDIQTQKNSRTLRAERPYEGMNITGVKDLSLEQLATLKALGAIENKI